MPDFWDFARFQDHIELIVKKEKKYFWSAREYVCLI